MITVEAVKERAQGVLSQRARLAAIIAEQLPDDHIVEVWGRRMTLRTANELELDFVLYGCAYSRLTYTGLVERIPPDRVRII